MLMETFRDRVDAGERLTDKLKAYANEPDVIVLGLARGGIPVAYVVAISLNVPLDVFIVRKIGVPGQPEYAMGAIASGGAYHLNEDVISQLSVSKQEIVEVVNREKKELERRELLYRGGRPAFHLKDRRVILIDDGLATGSSMLAAVRAVRSMQPKEVIVAVPVIAASSMPAVKREVDHLYYVHAPYQFQAVGLWYDDFGQTSDEEVQELLIEANQADQ